MPATMNKKIIHTVFESMAHTFPQHIAVRDESASITYGALNSSANYLAHLLKHCGVVTDSIVGVFVQPGIRLIQSVLAVFKSGGIYLPVDITHAPKRLQQILGDCEPGVLVVDAQQLEAVQSLLAGANSSVQYLAVHRGGQLELLKRNGGNYVTQPITGSEHFFADPELNVTGDDSNYIFYTSGSTGAAKAILGCHKSLAHFIDWERKEFGIDETFKVSMLSQFTFDASLRDIFIPLCSGGTLCIPAADTKGNALRLLEWLAENEVNLVHCVPSVFKLLTKEARHGSAREKLQDTLKYILMAGEPLYVKDITAWRNIFGENTTLVNLYGTSETTLAKTFNRIGQLPDQPGQAIHAGKPISNTVVAILNGHTPCMPGEVGEIYIRTPFITKGYYKNEALTKEVFVQNPLVTGRVDIMHKTGDFGRYFEDGTIEVLGRKDEQIKVNGIRVELGEVKRAIKGIEGVEETEVIAIKNANGENEMVCYYTGQEQPVAHLQQLLQHELNSYLIPSYFIYLPAFPLTVNGKIDKKSLPRPAEFLIDEQSYEAPASDMESRLEEMWMDILGLKKIGRKVSFFRIGGNSFKAIQFITRVYKEFEIQLRFNDIFINQDIASLAVLIGSKTRKAYEEILPVAKDEYYDISLAQKRLYIVSQLQQDQVAYNIPLSYVFEGNLNVEAFRTAFQELIARHESLRTTFTAIEGMPKQRVHEAGEFPFSMSYTDLRGQQHNMDKAAALVDAQALTPFDLSKGPLIAASLLQVEESKYVFALNMHHIISDGWSMEVLVHDVMAMYHAFARNEPNPLPPLRIQYKDYSAWQRESFNEQALNRSRKYWLTKLEGELPLLDLPIDFARPAEESFEGKALNYIIDKDLSRQLKEACSANDVTLFMYLVALVNVLMHKYTGQKDILIGSPIAGRPHRDLEDQIGFFVNMIVFRTKLDTDASFASLLADTRKNAAGAYEYEMYPFIQLAEDLNLTGGQENLFNVVVQLQNAKLQLVKNRSLDGIAISNFRPNSYTSKFDITFNFEDQADEGVITMDIEFKTALFRESTIHKMKEDFFRLMQLAAQDASASIRRLKSELAGQAEPALQLSALSADY